MNNQSIAFIGLGVMGYPMAGHLAKAGYQVTVYNRTQSKAENWVKEYPGQMAATPSQAAAEADIVFTCVRSEEHTSELQSRGHLVCRLLLEKKIGILMINVK